MGERETPDELQARLDAERAEYVAAQAIEYGTYRAKGPIHIDGVLAFTEGAPVPVSTAEARDYLSNGLVELVESANTADVMAAGDVALADLNAALGGSEDPPQDDPAAGDASAEEKD